MAKVDVLRAICGKGGMISYEDLEDMGLASVEELSSIITQNSDIFTEVFLGGRMFVTARSDISFCDTVGCLGCKSLHMCKDYMLGSCSDTGCLFSHDLWSAHNTWVLKKHGLNGLKEHEITVLLHTPEPPPRKPRPAPRQVYGKPNSPTTSDAVPQMTQASSGYDSICQMYLIYRCSIGDQCDKAHSKVPYLWQKKDGGQWRALPNNEEIEIDFCNPVKTKHDGNPPVHFDLMRCGSAEVRRLSVTSPVCQTLSLLVTSWVWYWEQEEDQWKEYRPPEGTADKLAITSEKLEQKYQDGAPSFSFAGGQNLYSVSFQDMIQTNLATEMKRLVRRRPVLISQAEVQNVCEKYSKRPKPNFLSSVPEHWNHSLLPGTGYERIKLESTSQEHRHVLRQFNHTMRKCNVLSVERIQNLKLWRFLMLQRNQMKNEAGKDVPVEHLFHGTESMYIDTICHGNIDWRVSGLKDSRLGKGSYFSRDASYANKYTDKHGVRSMFKCQVVVGDYALGHPDYNKPPFKDDKNIVPFDSCVDDLSQPSIYVIFERNQIYPEYLILYTSEEKTLQAAEPFYEQPNPIPAQPNPILVQTNPIQVQPMPIFQPPKITLRPPSAPSKSKRCDCDCDYDCDCDCDCDCDYCDCCEGVCFDCWP